MLRRVLLLLLLCLWAGEVRANYTEAHVGGVDARVVVSGDGRIVVNHVLTYRVLAGTLRSIALTGFEDDLHLRPTAAVTSSDGHTYGASVARDDKDVVHITVDDPKGLKRGDYRFELVYEGSLVSRVTRDGAFDRVRFALPPMREGIDSARVVFDLPSAPTEPRAVAEASTDDHDVTTDIATLRRSAERDELELVRPHVAKSEAATFFVRVDPKVLSQMDAPSLRAPLPTAASRDSAPAHDVPIGMWSFVVVCALVIFGIALAKGRVVTEMRGLVPLGASMRAVAAAIFFGAGVRVETDGRLLLGAALVACALPFLAWRARESSASRKVVGPAVWNALPEGRLGRHVTPADILDATTPRGVLALAIAIVALAVIARFSTSPFLIAIDALVLAPIFFTGTSRQMPPSAAREGAALAPIERALAGAEVAPHVRTTADGEIQETRLVVSSRVAMAGLSAIEVGVAWEGKGAWLAAFEVLVRVTDGTFAASKMAAAFPKKRALPGRTPEERVFRFEPDGWSHRSCASRIRELVEVLRDRRIVIAESLAIAAERRLPPNRRPASQAAA